MLIDDIDSSEEYDIQEDIDSLSSISPTYKPIIEQGEKTKEITPTQLQATSAYETIRMDVQIIDKLMRLAGELVLIRNQQLQLVPHNNPAVELLLQRLNVTTTEIQETVMKSRLQPVSQLFSKYQRIVRDISKQLNKEVELKIIGENVEIDKTYIDELAAPITHLIRNALDHGIEKTKQRTSNGKSAQGTLTLSAQQSVNLILISIKDDGQGININEIAEAAVNLGFSTHAEIQTLQARQIIDFIWLPGFTTSGTVTDISGRGVGMDAVHSSIAKLGGIIDIISSPGEGTEFIIKLPFTLSIIGSVIVKSSGECFAIPQVNVSEIVKISEEEFSEKVIFNQEGMFLYLRNTLFPLQCFNYVLATPTPFTEAAKQSELQRICGKAPIFPRTAIILKSGRGQFGLLIDQYIGSEEIVVKPLHPAIHNLRIYSGSTILGNGSLALILDIENVAQHTGLAYSNITPTYSFNKTENTDKNTLQLLFQYSQHEIFSLPLTAIKRILLFPKDSLQIIGNKKIVAYDDNIFSAESLCDIMGTNNMVENNELCLIILKNIGENAGLLASEILGVEKIDAISANNIEISKYVKYTSIYNKKAVMTLDVKLICEYFNQHLILDKK